MLTDACSNIAKTVVPARHFHKNSSMKTLKIKTPLERKQMIIQKSFILAGRKIKIEDGIRKPEDKKFSASTLSLL